MPLIDLKPNRTCAQEALTPLMPIIRPLIKETVDRIWGVGVHDVIVNLHECIVVDADDDAADVVMILETLPDPELGAKANELRDALAELWTELELALTFRIELWPRFVSGSWCAVVGGQVVDSVDHIV